MSFGLVVLSIIALGMPGADATMLVGTRLRLA
jgi:hypothetical protein